MKGFNVTPEEGSASSDGPVGAVMWVGHGGSSFIPCKCPADKLQDDREKSMKT